MKVLIVGHTGFIGNKLSEYLFKENHTLYGLSTKTSEKEYFCSQIKIDLLKICNNNMKILSNRIDFQKLDLVINCASILANNRNLNSMDLLYKNLKVTENLIRLLKIFNPKKLINLSSMAVYPDIQGKFCEKSLVYVGNNREGLYGLSKFCSENIFDFYLSNNIKTLHLRVSQVYGKNMNKDQVYSKMKKELSEKNYISVLGLGKRVSNFIEISKLCEIINNFIKKPDLTGVFNVGDKNISYKDLAKLIIKKYGNVKSKFILMEKGKKYKFVLCLDKLNSLNFKEKQKY